MSFSNGITYVVMISMPSSVVKWYSQTLASKSIQEFWISFSKTSKFTLHAIEADPLNLPHHYDLLKKAHLIVFTWNGPVYMRALRGHLKLQIPAIFYLAGEGSRGFSYSFGQVDLFTSSDIFVAVSRAEQKTLQLCFPKAKSVVLPYPYLSASQKLPFNQVKCCMKPIRLLFVGRYSEQKNLHTLLWSLRILLDKNPSLSVRVDFYGYEDKLGSPNMGIGASKYYSFLKSLTNQFNLNKIITWHSFVNNTVLKGMIQSTPHVLVSPSLYSEECFGLAPLDSLVYKNPVVLSAWGGYLDFRHRFKDLVAFVPVYDTQRGPTLCPFELAHQIKKQILHLRRKKDFSYHLPHFYSQRAVEQNLTQAIESFGRNTTPPFKLKKSRWLRGVHQQIALLNLHPEQALRNLRLKVYKNYEDPLVQKPFRLFGMNKKRPSFQTQLGKNTRCWLPPWVQASSRQVRISDPHRGVKHLTISEDTSLSVSAKSTDGSCKELPYLITQWLFENGYLFFEKN